LAGSVRADDKQSLQVDAAAGGVVGVEILLYINVGGQASLPGHLGFGNDLEGQSCHAGCRRAGDFTKTAERQTTDAKRLV